MSIVSRHPEISRDEFIDRWTGHHADLVRSAPGVSRYVQNLIDQARLSSSRGEDRGTIDGVAEFWYHNDEAMAAAHASEEWRSVIEDAQTLLASVTAFGVSEIIVIGAEVEAME